jgi:hypothetical protein
MSGMSICSPKAHLLPFLKSFCIVTTLAHWPLPCNSLHEAEFGELKHDTQ